jgi:hypothetical protein
MHFVVLLAIYKILTPQKPRHMVNVLFQRCIVGRVLLKCDMRLKFFNSVIDILFDESIKNELGRHYFSFKVSYLIAFVIVTLKLRLRAASIISHHLFTVISK